MADAYDFDRPIHVERHERPDVVIGRLAERQHGVVARRQRLAAGLTREAIAHRMRVGRLSVLHRGVYAVGHRLLSPEARWMAAVLAAGPKAVLSHRSAAALWGIRPLPGGQRGRHDVELQTATAPNHVARGQPPGR